MWNRRELMRRGAGASALAVLGWPLASRSQSFGGNAAIVSSFPAGGMGDNVARPIAEKLRGRYANSLTVDARTGAGGRIAVEYVKRAAPDGLTILQVPSSPTVLYPHTYRKFGYDPLADFAPVCSTVTYAFSFTAGPGLPAEIRTVEEWLGWFLLAKTPKATVDALNHQVREALSAPDYIAQLATYGLQPVHQSPEDFAKRVRADYDRWGPIVRATGFTAED